MDNIDEKDLKLGVEGIVGTFLTHCSYLSKVLDYLYKKNIFHVYLNLRISVRCLLTLPDSLFRKTDLHPALLRTEHYVASRLFSM